MLYDNSITIKDKEKFDKLIIILVNFYFDNVNVPSFIDNLNSI
jgi:hypothetical protein